MQQRIHPEPEPQPIEDSFYPLTLGNQEQEIQQEIPSPVPIIDSKATQNFYEKEDVLVFQIWEYTVDVLFGLDIIINFRCTFIDKDGEEVFSATRIAKHYIFNGSFLIDFFASLPFELIPILIPVEMDKNLELFQILKMIRLLRLRRIITYLRFKTDFKQSLRIMLIIFNLFLFIHIVGSFWHMLVDQDEKWQPPKYAGQEHNFYKTGYYSTKYSVSLYYATLLLLGNDILPYTEGQTVYSTIALLIGALVTAALFGHMTVLVQKMNKRTAKFHNRLDVAHQAMTNIVIPKKVQHKVIEYICYTYDSRDLQKELNKFFKLLSPSIQQEVKIYLYRDILRNSPIFSDNWEIIEQMLLKVTTRLASPEDTIISRDEESNEIYFIQRGEIQICTINKQLHELESATLYPLQFLGEIALLMKSKRTATAKAKNYCTLASISGDHFSEVLEAFPGVKQDLLQHIFNYDDEFHVYKTFLLKSVPYFSMISSQDLSYLAFKMHVLSLEQNQVLIKRKKVAEFLAFIVKGGLSILIETADRDPFPCKFLGPNCSVLVFSAIDQIPVQNTIIANQKTSLLILPYSHIQELGMNNSQFGEKMRGIKARALVDSIALKNDYFDYEYDPSLLSFWRQLTIRIMKGHWNIRWQTKNKQIDQLMKGVHNLIETNRQNKQRKSIEEFRRQLNSIQITSEELIRKVESLIDQKRIRGLSGMKSSAQY